jgi:hypothetical protein
MDQTLWIENTPAQRVRVDVHKEVDQWTGGTAPFYQDQYSTVYDGKVSRQLTIAQGPPQHFEAHLEGRINISYSGPRASPWGQTIYGAIDLQTNPPMPKIRLSDALLKGAVRRVTLNGRDCVEILLSQPLKVNLFVDPAHGWALVGYDWSVPQRIVERYVVKELMSAGQGIEIPADVIGVVMPNNRYELRTTVAVANDPAWPDQIFQLDWPPDLKVIWDDRTHQAIRLPSNPPPSTTPAVGEHGL